MATSLTLSDQYIIGGARVMMIVLVFVQAGSGLHGLFTNDQAHHTEAPGAPGEYSLVRVARPGQARVDVALGSRVELSSPCCSVSVRRALLPRVTLPGGLFASFVCDRVAFLGARCHFPNFRFSLPRSFSHVHQLVHLFFRLCVRSIVCVLVCHLRYCFRCALSGWPHPSSFSW